MQQGVVVEVRIALVDLREVADDHLPQLLEVAAGHLRRPPFRAATDAARALLPTISITGMRAYRYPLRLLPQPRRQCRAFQRIISRLVQRLVEAEFILKSMAAARRL